MLVIMVSNLAEKKKPELTYYVYSAICNFLGAQESDATIHLCDLPSIITSWGGKKTQPSCLELLPTPSECP
jgi:hypothetical protein